MTTLSPVQGTKPHNNVVRHGNYKYLPMTPEFKKKNHCCTLK